MIKHTRVFLTSSMRLSPQMDHTFLFKNQLKCEIIWLLTCIYTGSSAGVKCIHQNTNQPTKKQKNKLITKISNNNIPNWQSSEVVLAIKGTDGNKRCASFKDTMISVLTQIYTATKLGYQVFQVGQLICFVSSKQRVVTYFVPKIGIPLARRQRGSYSRSALLYAICRNRKTARGIFFFSKQNWSRAFLKFAIIHYSGKIESQRIATNILSVKKVLFQTKRSAHTTELLWWKFWSKPNAINFSPYTEGAKPTVTNQTRINVAGVSG